MNQFNCDYQDCPHDGVWHIEDNGFPWETNCYSCNEHLSEMVDTERPNIVTLLTESNKQETLIKRAYGHN